MEDSESLEERHGIAPVDQSAGLDGAALDKELRQPPSSIASTHIEKPPLKPEASILQFTYKETDSAPVRCMACGWEVPNRKGKVYFLNHITCNADTKQHIKHCDFLTPYVQRKVDECKKWEDEQSSSNNPKVKRARTDGSRSSKGKSIGDCSEKDAETVSPVLNVAELIQFFGSLTASNLSLRVGVGSLDVSCSADVLARLLKQNGLLGELNTLICQQPIDPLSLMKVLCKLEDENKGICAFQDVFSSDFQKNFSEFVTLTCRLKADFARQICGNAKSSDGFSVQFHSSEIMRMNFEVSEMLQVSNLASDAKIAEIWAELDKKVEELFKLLQHGPVKRNAVFDIVTDLSRVNDRFSFEVELPKEVLVKLTNLYVNLHSLWHLCMKKGI